MVEMTAHAAVVGVVPGQDDLVILTAASWARAVQAPTLYFAFADVSRYAFREHPDGTVAHAPLDPDSVDDSWKQTESHLRDHLADVLRGDPVHWELRYLAGRPDRALTHLARAVDAAVIIVGTRAPGSGPRMREFFEGSVAVHLAQHQHRPVLIVPLSVVDWKFGKSVWHD